MNNNLQNGGLVTKHKDTLFVTDIGSFKGTNVFSTTTELVDGLFWFMNRSDNVLYFSDQRRGNSLCKRSLGSREVEVIMNKPCYQVTHYKEWLYYINEINQQLYRCSLDGGEEEIINEQIESFVMLDDQIIYSTPQGIRRCTERGKDREIIHDALTSFLLYSNEKLAYGDRRKNNTLTILDLTSNEVEVIERIQVTSMNQDGRYLYCANKLNNRTIYRVDPLSGASFRISADSADYLHVIDSELYYTHQREWKKVSLTGGESVVVNG